MVIKALTIYQPWAHLIAIGDKPFENRKWETLYRGPLAIHAGLNRRFAGESPLAMLPKFNFGAIIAVVNLVACPHISILKEWIRVAPIASSFAGLHASPHAEGPFCWAMNHVHYLREPIYCKGNRRLWNFSQPTKELRDAWQHVLSMSSAKSAD